MKQQCSSCQYYRLANATSGECRFNPPTTLFIDDYTITMWAVVNSEDWCGKWLESQDWVRELNDKKLQEAMQDNAKVVSIDKRQKGLHKKD